MGGLLAPIRRTSFLSRIQSNPSSPLIAFECVAVLPSSVTVFFKSNDLDTAQRTCQSSWLSHLSEKAILSNLDTSKHPKTPSGARFRTNHEVPCFPYEGQRSLIPDAGDVTKSGVET